MAHDSAGARAEVIGFQVLSIFFATCRLAAISKGLPNGPSAVFVPRSLIILRSRRGCRLNPAVRNAYERVLGGATRWPNIRDAGSCAFAILEISIVANADHVTRCT